MNVQLKRLVFVLLFWPVPVMAAAQISATAPPQVEQQVRDGVLEQWQMRTREAEIRAEQAERREWDAELDRLADQAKQAQSRADMEEQLKRAVQRELFIQQAKAELQNNAYARLEILIGAFGILITILVIFFALSTKNEAVVAATQAAVAAAEKSVGDIRDKIRGMADESGSRLADVEAEAEATVAKIRDHATKVAKIVAGFPSGEAPKSEADRIVIEGAAREASAKPPRDRTANEYRAIIVDLLTKEKWADMLTAAQQMRLLHEGEEDFSFALFYEGVGLGRLGRSEEAIAVYDNVVARYGAATGAGLREPAAKAIFNKGVILGQLGRSEEAIAVYDNVVALYGAATEAGLRQPVAGALFNKGIELVRLNRGDEAIAVFDDVVARYGAATEAGLREQVVKALYNKAGVYARKGSAGEATMALRAMLKAGHPLNLDQIANYSEFDPIRNDPAFKLFLDENKG